MSHMIPETMLEFDPQGREDLVFNALKVGLGDGYWVFHSCSVNQTGRDGSFYEKEIDFVIYHREKGILCLEVKNGSGISYYGGIWRYSSGQPMPHHGPFKQAQFSVWRGSSFAALCRLCCFARWCWRPSWADCG